MLRGCWLSLLPVTDSKLNHSSTEQAPPEEHQPILNQVHSTAIQIPPRRKNQLHLHDHQPHLNAILKPIILDSPSSRRHKPSHHPQSHSFLILPLQDNLDSTRSTFKSSFEIRSLQVCDIDKVKELHSSTLPVSYPSSFFYNLLSSNSEGIISLVATLPSTGSQSYFDSFHSHSHHHYQHQCRSPLPISTLNHHHHHITSPLSGRKPISLDVVGCITARLPHFKNSRGKEDGSIRILTLCVNPDYRRFGVGKMLLEELIKKVKMNFSSTCSELGNNLIPRKLSSQNQEIDGEIKINLHVQATNSVAFNFYLKNGFKKVCFKPNYYLNNDLKPLDPGLKKIQIDQQNQLDRYTQSESNQLDKKDVDAWLLELTINF